MSNTNPAEARPFAVTLDVGTSLLNKTGSWRTERPVYVDRLPPCNAQCPAGENIQAWLGYAEEGNYEAAWRQIMDDNPLPAVMGRVCYHSCETACNRIQLDDAVGINSVERFLGDQAIQYGWKMQPGKDTGKRVMVLGAGPAGLATAYHLRRFGHAVTIYESAPKAGGTIRYGIPRYRMPREKLAAEIQRIEDMGVEIKLNTRVDDVLATSKEGNFDAVFLGIGAQLPKCIEIPVEGDMQVLDALKVLRDNELENPSQLRGRVIVYGGGNTAMDVARTSIRLGALETTVITRGPREAMPAHALEIHEALEEGAEFINLRSIKEVIGNQVKLEVMVAGEDGKPQATGQFEYIEADLIVLALGQQVDTDMLDKVPQLVIDAGNLQTDTGMQTGAIGIFAGGDMVPCERTVTIAIGHGKKAARNIDAYLRGKKYQPAAKHDVVGYDQLNTWYYSDAPRSVRPMLDIVRRSSGFAEVVGNLTEDNAVYEARRCMSCGNCFECDNCYGVCPDNSITKLGPGKRFEFKYDYCKGCALCASECPCGAIKMEAEDI
ncbi:MAG: NAD(P)-binding protein [Gammaproteobacteria bacterium]|nr:NAD(P)-binding protein [Gammaproteobacteria bacterium]